MTGSTESLSRPFSLAAEQWPYQMRRATLDDLDDILAIERRCFRSPCPKSVFVGEISGRSWSRVVVAERDQVVVGYMVYWIVTTEIHLLNLAVHPDWRRQAVARTLLSELIATSRRDNREEILLEVRASNQAAQRLYHQLSFVEIAIRPGYYSDNGEDAIVMVRQVK